MVGAALTVMRTMLMSLLLPVALIGCARSHPRSEGTTAVPPAPEFSMAGSTEVEAPAPASDGDDALLPEDQIFFGLDSDALDDGDRKLLGDVAVWVRAAHDRRVLLVGSADPTGSAEHNLDLSSRRAQAAAAYLRSLGVPDDRITIATAGEAGAVVQPGPVNRRVLILATQARAVTSR